MFGDCETGPKIALYFKLVAHKLKRRSDTTCRKHSYALSGFSMAYLLIIPSTILSNGGHPRAIQGVLDVEIVDR